VLADEIDMRYAVFLTFDDKTQTALQTLREGIVRHVPGAPKIDGKMGPHMTLAVFDDQNQAAVLEKFENLAAGFYAFKINLHNLGFFDGRWKILYAAPLASPDLQSTHKRAHKVFSAASVMVPHYRDQADWVPHVTLSKGLKGRIFTDVKACAEKSWKPLSATAGRTGLVNVQRPLEVLVTFALR
jgi:2'-5' RNA ligase